MSLDASFVYNDVVLVSMCIEMLDWTVCCVTLCDFMKFMLAYVEAETLRKP